MNTIAEYLQEYPLIVLDGAFGTELARRGRFFKSRQERIALSDWAICNDGDTETLYARLAPVWDAMTALAARKGE